MNCLKCNMNNNCVGFDDCPYLRIKKLEEVIIYALKINERSHGDDYPNDDCWGKMKEIIKGVR